MPEIVEVDGHDPVARPIHLHPPHLPEPLHLPPHRPLADVLSSWLNTLIGWVGTRSGARWLLDAPATAPSFTGTPITSSDGYLRAQNAHHRLNSWSSGDPFGDKDIAFSREHLNNDCCFQIKNNKSWEIQAFTNGSSGENCDGGVKTLKQQPLP
ncbi:hypothetical protein ACFX13_014346 [Malus domestica]